MLTDEHVTAASCGPAPRRRWRRAATRTRVVDGFRAIAVRQVERGRLDDAPGATAHEVAERAGRASTRTSATGSHGSAALFDPVLYGDRPATREQATAVLALDDELAAGDDRDPSTPARRTRRAPGSLRRHRSTLLIGAGAGRRPRRRDRAGHAAPRPRPRWTPTTPARRAPGRWPGCWTTRASTSRSAAAPTTLDAPTSTPAPRCSSPPPSSSAPSTIERLLDHDRRAHTWWWPAPARASPTRSASPAAAASVPLGEGRDRRLRRPARSTASPSRSTARPSIPSGGCFDGKDGAIVAEPTRRPAALRRRAGAHQRPDPARPTTPRSRCGCSARTTGWSGTSRRSTTWSATTASACGACCPRWLRPALWLLGARHARRRRSGGSRRLGAAGHRAAAGRRHARRDDPQPGPALPPRRRPRPCRGRRCAGRPGPAGRAAAARLRRPDPRRWSATWPAAPAARGRHRPRSSARRRRTRPPTAT